MYRILIVTGLLLFIACSQEQNTTQDQATPQVLTHWLSGDWNTESGEAIIQAHWDHPRRNYWECHAKRQDFHGNALPDQDIWIKERKDDLYWISLTPEGDSIFLKAKTIDTRQMVFENKENKDPLPEQIKMELQDSVTFRVVEYMRDAKDAVRISAMNFQLQ
ncbi:MAG: hypothetical protein H6561_16610 [Lewinellaceae bacterium]|nr:hypothetical protein [Lewinellaceae bacterium]HQU53410.1 hypothetical protein [Saprospiraceae bacterium]